MKDKSNKTFWQRVAFIYSRFMRGNDKVFDAMSNIIQSHLQSDFQVLELACGTGQITYRLCNYVSKWIATDFSENMLEQAKKKGSLSKLIFEQADATNLKYENSQFDAIVIANCLHIMPEPEKALQEIYRVLKPEGLLIAPTFVYEPGYSKLKIAMMERVGFHTYHKWMADEYVDFVEKHGFKTYEQMIIPGHPVSECLYIGKKMINVKKQL